ncbi:branched-chain amino acid transport system substrate-binding protein [Bradyrhizobium sp. LA6.10]|uniref:branched-chain amino acid ABC transporter substrate-binding protein n=1 Tax=Bradyrhizobium sp. LA6.10 TaxID=3156318 RepID=UPI0033925B5F
MSILAVHRLATAALLSSILSSSAWAKDVYIAVAGPMMGSTAALVAQIRDGASAAVDSINASRLLADTKLVLRISDDAWDPKQAAAVASRLATDGIKFVFGQFCLSSSIPASDIYTEAKVLQISPGSTNPFLTERDATTLFRICRRDDQLGGVAADYIVPHHQGAKLAVLDDKSTAGKAIDDIVEARLRAAGEHTVRQSYAAEEGLRRSGFETEERGNSDRLSRRLLQRDRPTRASKWGGGPTSGRDRQRSADAKRVFGHCRRRRKRHALHLYAGPDEECCRASPIARLKTSSLSAAGYVLCAYAAVQAWAESIKQAGTFDPTPIAAAPRSGSIKTTIGTVRLDSKGHNAAPGSIVYRWRDNSVDAVEQNGSSVPAPHGAFER